MIFKDANDCLLAGVSGDAMRACVDGARDFAPNKVKNAREFFDAYMDEWFNKRLDDGLKLPFEFPWYVRHGELTVWTGIEKSGKTTLLGFVLMALMAQGERALVASLEILGVKTLKKYSRQAAGMLIYSKDRAEKMAPEDAADYRAEREREAVRTLNWIGRTLWLYDHTGIAQWRTLLDDIRWARRRHGITQVVLDNFMRLGFVKDDYAQQAECVMTLAALAMELRIHIHLVVHQNKTEGHKGSGGGKRTVSGAFEIIANAHNIVEVLRDVNKGEKVSALFQDLEIGKLPKEEFVKEMGKLDLEPDGKFVLHSARDGERQNAAKYLWFLADSQQYCDRPKGHANHAPICFVQMQEAAETRAQADDLPTEQPN